MKKLILTTCTAIISLLSICQTENEITFAKDDYVLYSVKKGKVVEPSDIIKDMANYNVLFFGEEHNDSIGHRMQTLIFQLLAKEFGKRATLSMEMFDRDVQYIMDEYLQGRIKEYYFNKDSRQWQNYKDYKPMVELAKAGGLDVICANAPFRYVSIATKGGMEALMALSDRAKEAMAPLPYNMADGKYAEKLDALMSHNEGGPAYNMKPGQSLWDATMAYSIYQYIKKHPEAKVLHLNGRFHSDEHFGIVQRLAEFDSSIKPLVISLEGNAENYPKVNFKDYEHLGEYIIFTNPAIAKSY